MAQIRRLAKPLFVELPQIWRRTVTGGPANTGDAIFEESLALLLYGQPIQHQLLLR